MRIAAMIIALGLMLVVGLQSCAVFVGGSAIEDQATSDGGALGIFVALLFLIGAAFVLAFPLASFIAFTLAGIVGLGGGASTEFTDLTIWGIVSFVLAVLSLLAIREKRKKSQSSRVT